MYYPHLSNLSMLIWLSVVAMSVTRLALTPLVFTVADSSWVLFNFSVYT